MHISLDTSRGNELTIEEAGDADLPKVTTALTRTRKHELGYVRFNRCRFTRLTVDQTLMHKDRPNGYLSVHFVQTHVDQLDLVGVSETVFKDATIVGMTTNKGINIAASRSSLPWSALRGKVISIAIGDGVPLLQPYVSGYEDYVYDPEYTYMSDPDLYRNFSEIYKLGIFRAKLAMRLTGPEVADNAHL